MSRRLPSSTRALAALLPLGTLLAACGDASLTGTRADARAPREPSTLRPLAAMAAAEAPTFAFLPPLAPARAFAGRFDAAKSPLVELCVVETLAAEACAEAPLARYPLNAAGEGPAAGTARLTVDAAAQQYKVDWPVPGGLAGGTPLPVGTIVRVRVLLGATLVGQAHAKLPAPGETPTAITAAGMTPIGNGSRLPVRFRLETPAEYDAGTLPALPGAATDPAATATPRLVYAPRAADYAVPNAAMPGLGVSHTTALVALARGATVGAVNALLAQTGATVVGAMPGRAGTRGAVLALRFTTTTHAELAAKLATWRAATAVAQHVAPDALVEGAMVPHVDPAAVPAWHWGVAPGGYNWNLELVRAPQLWNLNAAIAKRYAQPNGMQGRPITAVLEAGFEWHPALPALTPSGSGAGAQHGTMVAGIVGAAWNSGRSNPGLNPYTALHGVPMTMTGAGLERRVSVGRALIFGLDSLLRSTAGVNTRVVNSSLGYNWGRLGLDPRTNTTVQELVHDQGQIAYNTLAILAEERGGRLPVIVSAAGNDSYPGVDVPARYASPLNRIADVVRAIVVVEAVKLDAAAPGGATRAAFSNTGGMLSAPGQDVTSTGAEFDMRGSGTSLAAPHVAAVASYLYALLPDLAMASLTTNPAADLMVLGSVSVGGGAAPRVDAFGAAMAADRGGQTRVLRMLTDVDDGTSDGNTRVRLGQPVLDEDADGDGGAGDGAIDMADFRRWRDWLLETERYGMLRLDGAATHPKRDVNGNGTADAAGDGENVFPRGDFNGDGRLSRSAKAVVGGAFGTTPVTDLEVLQRLFADEEVNKHELPTLLETGDVTVDASACFTYPGARVVRTDVIDRETGLLLERRTHDLGRTERTITVRVKKDEPFGTPFTVRTEVYDIQDRMVAVDTRHLSLGLGEDRQFAARCIGVQIVPRELTVKAGDAADLEAIVRGLGPNDDKVVGWTAAKGQVTRSTVTTGEHATYLAPNEITTDTVWARSQQNPDAKAMAIVHVEGRMPVAITGHNYQIGASARDVLVSYNRPQAIFDVYRSADMEPGMRVYAKTASASGSWEGLMSSGSASHDLGYVGFPEAVERIRASATGGASASAPPDAPLSAPEIRGGGGGGHNVFFQVGQTVAYELIGACFSSGLGYESAHVRLFDRSTGVELARFVPGSGTQAQGTMRPGSYVVQLSVSANAASARGSIGTTASCEYQLSFRMPQ